MTSAPSPVALLALSAAISIFAWAMVGEEGDMTDHIIACDCDACLNRGCGMRLENFTPHVVETEAPEVPFFAPAVAREKLNREQRENRARFRAKQKAIR